MSWSLVGVKGLNVSKQLLCDGQIKQQFLNCFLHHGSLKIKFVMQTIEAFSSIQHDTIAMLVQTSRCL